MDNRKVSLCIPVYNRFELLLESFDKVKDDPRISEICIWDDGSKIEILDKIVSKLQDNPKAIIGASSTNEGVHKAKKHAVQMAENEWVILFDSDNIIDKDYLDTIYSSQTWVEYVAYQPSYLAPYFDFRDKEGWIVDKNNLQNTLNTPNNKVDTWGNAQNFFINRNEYLKVWEEGENINGNDSLWFFYLWMKAGNVMELVPNLQYFHRVHDNSTKEQKGNYNSDSQAGMKIEKTMNLIRQLTNGNKPQ